MGSTLRHATPLHSPVKVWETIEIRERQKARAQKENVENSN